MALVLLSIEALQHNTLYDGLFHLFAYLCVLIGIVLAWYAAQSPGALGSGRQFVGRILIGFGLFSVVEGVINHHLLGLHHVNETVPLEQWVVWDIGFLLWGAAMLVGGAYLARPLAG